MEVLLEDDVGMPKETVRQHMDNIISQVGKQEHQLITKVRFVTCGKCAIRVCTKDIKGHVRAKALSRFAKEHCESKGTKVTRRPTGPQPLLDPWAPPTRGKRLLDDLGYDPEVYLRDKRRRFDDPHHTDFPTDFPDWDMRSGVEPEDDYPRADSSPREPTDADLVLLSRPPRRATIHEHRNLRIQGRIPRRL